MDGLGVDHDEDKAVEWLNKAATQNHTQAQYLIITMCFQIWAMAKTKG